MHVTSKLLVALYASAVAVSGIPTQGSSGDLVPTEAHVTSDMEIPVEAKGAPWDRRELSSDFICGHFYEGFWQTYIIQVPPEWWKKKYEGIVARACDKYWGVIGQELQGLVKTGTECWEMDKQYPSGGPHWLHIRFNIPVGPYGDRALAVVERLADPAGMAQVPKEMSCRSHG